MFVPAPPAQPALALAPVEIDSSVASFSALALGQTIATTLDVRRETLNVLDGHRASVTGNLVTRHGGVGLSARTVRLQALGRHGWRVVAGARTGAGGRFTLRFLARQTGSRRVRLRFAGDPLDHASERRLGAVNVFRLAGASWYGGGGSVACGGALTSSTLGVANKTLPCGTLVTLRYGGRSIRVPVIDRGPYVAGREFDLTEATKRALGFGDTGEVWSTR